MQNAQHHKNSSGETKTKKKLINPSTVYVNGIMIYMKNHMHTAPAARKTPGKTRQCKMHTITQNSSGETKTKQKPLNPRTVHVNDIKIRIKKHMRNPPAARKTQEKRVAYQRTKRVHRLAGDSCGCPQIFFSLRLRYGLSAAVHYGANIC